MRSTIIAYTFLLSIISCGLNALDRLGLASMAETPDQRKIVEVINHFAFDAPEFQPVLHELSRMNVLDIRDTLNQLSGIQYTNLILNSELATRQFNRRVFDPVRPYLMANPCTPYAYCTYKQTIDFWLASAGGRSFIHENRKAKGYHFTNFDIVFGAQVRFVRELIIGAAVFFERNIFSYHVGGRVRNNTVLGGLYALYRPKYFYVFGDFSVGNNTNKIQRRIDISRLHMVSRSNRQVNQGGFYVEIGTDLGYGFALLQPFVALEVGGFQFQRIRERDAAPLNLSTRGSSNSTACSRLGVHISSAPLKNGWLTGLDLSWNYRLNSQNNFVKTKFKDFGHSFRINCHSLGKNSIEGTVFINKKINKCWDFYFEGNAIGWQNAFSFSFIAGALWTW